MKGGEGVVKGGREGGREGWGMCGEGWRGRRGRRGRRGQERKGREFKRRRGQECMMVRHDTHGASK